MIDLASLDGPTQALALVGIVLVEALVLYVGYGGLTRVAGPKIVQALKN